MLWLCAAVLGCACVTTGKRQDASGWVEVKTPHLHIRAQLDEAAAIEVALSMEAVRSGLTAFLGPNFAPDDHLDVVLFADHASLSDFAHDSVRAVLVETHAGPWLLTSLTAYERSSFQIVQAHELAHHLGAYILLWRPRWLSEGLASYLETIELDRVGNRVILGKIPSWVQPDALAAKPMSLEAMWGWEANQIPPKDAHDHVAHSWRLVHHLLDSRGDQFAAFRRLLGTGADPRAAWAEAFRGVTDAVLEAELATQLQFAEVTIPLKLEPVQPVASPMSRAEVHAVRAVLQINSDEPRDRSRSLRKIKAHVDAALAVDPKNERALLVTAWLLVDDVERIAFLRQVVALLPHSGHALEALALNLAQRREDPRELLTQALKLEPRSSNILNNLARATAEWGEGAKAVELAQRAVAQRPWSADFVATLAQALAAAGRCPEAVARHRQALELRSHSGSGKNILEASFRRAAERCDHR